MAPASAFPLATAGLHFSTETQPAAERRDWWREVICRHYAQVDIVSTLAADYHGETRILPLPDVQLSAVRSGTIAIERPPRDPVRNDQDAYFAVLLLSGTYRLQQDGREAALQPGDMAIYDATRRHRLDCFGNDFAKLIFSVPRPLLQRRVAGIERSTAVRIAGDRGVGAIVANFLRTSAYQIDHLAPHEQAKLGYTAIDMLTWSLDTLNPIKRPRSPRQETALLRVKAYIEQHLRDPELDTAMIAAKVGLSPRYINNLFAADDTSLMRYVLQRRLEYCHRELSAGHNGLRVSDVAFRWGFNDLSHFSRVFKQRFGVTPRQLPRTG